MVTRVKGTLEVDKNDTRTATSDTRLPLIIRFSTFYDYLENIELAACMWLKTTLDIIEWAYS